MAPLFHRAAINRMKERWYRCKDMDYPARRSYLHLCNLETRRLTADLILIFNLGLQDYFRFSGYDRLVPTAFC